MKESECYPGKRVGRLTLISRKRVHTKNYGNRWQWLCKCDCGNTREVLTFQLGSYQHGKYPSKGVTDCGNHKFENLSKIGKKGVKPNDQVADSNKRSKWSRLYTKWIDMLRRCENSEASNYSDYGGRGIKVCDDWHKYDNFKKWAISQNYNPENRNRNEQSLDRIDVNGNYEPLNCRFTDTTVQANNLRTNRKVTISGVTKNASEWAREYGINRDTFQSRLDAGITGEELLLPANYRANWHKGKTILFHGKELSYNELGKLYNLYPRTIKYRYERQGLRDDDLVRPTKFNKKKEEITV